MGSVCSIRTTTKKVASRGVSEELRSEPRVEQGHLRALVPAMGAPATAQNPTHSVFRLTDQTPTLSPRTSSRNEADFVIVWDFDWSMINECVDYWFLRQFGTTSAFIDTELKRIKAEQNGRVPSPVLMDRLFLFMFDNFGISADTIFSKVVHVPFFAEHLELIRFLYAAGVPQWIVSDANQLFIEKILEHHNISECFTEIHTNVGRVQANGCLRVDPYVHSHDCRLSPCLEAPNLCKGSVMRMIKNRYTDGTMFCFVGDGSGDFCAGVHLEENDTLFVRTGRSLEKLVEKDLATGNGLLTCRVILWNDGVDLQREVVARAVVPSAPDLSSSIQEKMSAAPAA